MNVEESSVPIKDATADVEKSHLKDASPASSILAGVSSSLNTPKSDADAAIVGETSVQKSVRELRSAYFVEKKAACKNEDDTGGADETGV